ncbi:coiled-coil domain-containing protein 19 related [Cyclospora cayetanensis]|uniref:Cilia- and flagella-associated protein 45 n=1 Tax=Cyclospora cayetanensis TaxID=88456 RepID=A0A1D3CUW5_9EIME|nr:coiled-coil domain-containing protein 19 related [Cyclospora cayetanensis]
MRRGDGQGVSLLDERRQRRARGYRYRRIASSSLADDCLFRPHLSSVESLDWKCRTLAERDMPAELNFSEARAKARSGIYRDAQRLFLEELEQIKGITQFQPAVGPQAKENLEERNSRATELRKRMLETDNQWKERGTCVQATACVSSSNSVLSKAQEAQEENRESVRDMNSILLTCRVDAIRAKQIQLKRQAEEERERLEKELDAKIEEERLKATKTMEEREAARQDKLRLQETMIKQQIDERQKKRQLELEETKKERVLVLQQMEALKLEDELAKRQKEETARKMQIEINEHNRKILTGQWKSRIDLSANGKKQKGGSKRE